MTMNALADALTELLDNEGFAEQVSANADGALAAFDLTTEERGMIVDDAEAMSSETSGFAVKSLRSLGAVRIGMQDLSPKNGALLGGAVSRAVEGCGEHGCCAWESALK